MKTIFGIFIIVLLIGTSAYAQKSEIFAPEGVAIKGYDPVAFFKESKPVAGKKEYATEWKGATWLFSKEKNLQDFQADPKKYAPQYGGYCAFGATKGYKAPTEANTWTIVNQKLYLNYNLEVKDQWTKNQEEFIKKADQNWLNIQHQE